MGQKVLREVDLKKISTFRMGGKASEVIEIYSEEELEGLFRSFPEGKKWFILGGGSNIVFPNTQWESVIIRPLIQGIEVKDIGNEVELSVGSGEVWDDVVRYAVENGYSGIEALSAIPGLAGATPIQNVGAYGTEISNVLVSLRAFDAKEKKFVELSNAECLFGYRDSIFKGEQKGRYIITCIRLRLSKNPPSVPSYAGVKEYLEEKGIIDPSLYEIREAITTIRWRKLPDPKDVASVGSFFKNPYVAKKKADELKERFPGIKVFSVDEETVKIPAGWLIESLGFKGKSFGNISTYKNNALVLVNEGNATQEELRGVVKKIQEAVFDTYGIQIEPEPELLTA